MIPAEYNPFEPPERTADPAVESSLQPWRTVVERFRKASRVLAGLAVFIAILWACLMALLAPEIFLLPGIVVSTGLLGLGVQVARKKIWAVRVLMIVAYAALGLIAALCVLAPIPWTQLFLVIPAAVLGFVAAQCHRVIGFSRTITAAGIPLNIKPHQINLNELTRMKQRDVL